MPFSQYSQDSDPFRDAVHLPATSRAWPKPLPDGTTKSAGVHALVPSYSIPQAQRLEEDWRLKPGLLESLGFLLKTWCAVDSFLYGRRVAVKTDFPGEMCLLASGCHKPDCLNWGSLLTSIQPPPELNVVDGNKSGEVHPVNQWALPLPRTWNFFDVTSTDPAQWAGLWILVLYKFAICAPPP